MNEKNEAALPKAFDPAGIEDHWYTFWEERGTFIPKSSPGAEPYCIVIPPPNVTGNLHAGHALDMALQDVLIRWRRMQGRDTLWLPGTDHAGIATQTMVERGLAARGTSRHDLGREAFLKEVWAWKDKHGNAILDQLRRLGCSCDWTRTRFTLDEGLSRSVREVFVSLYEEGLIYRAKYIVNWCPRCDTALSDLEVEHKQVPGHLYHIRYPLADGPGSIVVATTRPETMLGDTGMAIGVGDERYANLLGKSAVLPLVGRHLPFFEDDYVDPEFGTGVVKVTPAHDPNDFEMGKRHGLETVDVIDRKAKMTDQCPEEFRGMDRFECREAVVKRLEEDGFLEKTEDYQHQVGHCYRCKTMVEPQVSMQWFVKIDDLAAPAIEAVESGRVEFVPDHWSKTYLEWMRNIHDWCISRQLWWGHRIPAWYCGDCDDVTVAREAPTACSSCGSANLRQEEDVLDTWFSSALWPFSTLGWPDETEDLKRYYPTSVLITGYDIIFFWVARMIMMGLRFHSEVPFHQVFIHGLLRDKDNKKMSKTAGNAVDPLELLDKYGTDAVRFTLCAMCTPGNDLPLDYDPETKESARLSGYRAFCNKLWNATRFVLMNIQGREVGDGKPAPGDWPERWILSRLENAVEKTLAAFEEYRFDQATHTLYQFLWRELCDWYIEMAKPYLGGEGDRAVRARGVTLHVIDRILRLLHPVMPFITEELWQRLDVEGDCLAEAAYPHSRPELRDEEAERNVGLWTEVVQTARNVRVQAGIDPGQKVPLHLASQDAAVRRILEEGREAVGLLARCEPVEVFEALPDAGPVAKGVLASVEMQVLLEGVVDAEAERDRHRRELGKIEKELDRTLRKLANEDFLLKAPEEVVAKTHRIRDELLERKRRHEEALAALGE